MQIFLHHSQSPLEGDDSLDNRIVDMWILSADSVSVCGGVYWARVLSPLLQSDTATERSMGHGSVIRLLMRMVV